MILLPKLRQFFLINAAQAFCVRHHIYLNRVRIKHTRIILGIACLLLLFGILLSLPQARVHPQPYITYDKVSSQPIDIPITGEDPVAP